MKNLICWKRDIEYYSKYVCMEYIYWVYKYMLIKYVKLFIEKVYGN